MDYPDPQLQLSKSTIQDIRDQVVDKKNGSVDRQLLASMLRDNVTFRFIVATREFLCYDPPTGTFIEGAEEKIAELVRSIIPDQSTTRVVSEVQAWIRDVSQIWLPDLESKPKFINLMNGVYDAGQGKLLPHSPDYNFRHVLPFEYNPRAKCVAFLDFLKDATKDDPRKAIRSLETFAWPFIPGYPIQKALCLYGTGNNGKSTLLGVLSSFLGRRNVSSLPLQVLADYNNRFASAELRGKLANISGDVGNQTIYDSSQFKLLTGGDPVSSEIKGVQRRVDFESSTKMIFGLNVLPRSRDLSTAFFRRFELIEFIQNYEGHEDKRLKDKLTSKEELQGIFNLVTSVFLPALSAKLEFEFTESASEVEARYRLNSDSALAYFSESVEEDPESQIPAEELYQEYLLFCKERRIAPVTEESFGISLLRDSGMIVQKRKIQEKGIWKAYYVRLRRVVQVPPDNKETGSIRGFVEVLREYLNRYPPRSVTGVMGVIGLSHTAARFETQPGMENRYDTCDTYDRNGILSKLTKLIRINLNNGKIKEKELKIAGKLKNYTIRDQDIVYADMIEEDVLKIILDRGLGVPFEVVGIFDGSKSTSNSVENGNKVEGP
jgi:putative DNA primase/helicase